MRGFFSSIRSEDFIELLEVKLSLNFLEFENDRCLGVTLAGGGTCPAWCLHKSVCGGSPMSGSCGVFSSQVDPF